MSNDFAVVSITSVGPSYVNSLRCGATLCYTYRYEFGMFSPHLTTATRMPLKQPPTAIGLSILSEQR